ALALVLMAALLAVAVPRLDWVALREQPLLRIALALGLVAAAAGVYLGTLAALGLRLRQFIRRTGESA
ncbi:MAG: lipid II flippase MurJ, partial [Burkholderiales bacterium]